MKAHFYVDHLDVAHIVIESENQRIIFCDAVVQNCAGCHKPILPLNKVMPRGMTNHQALAYFQNWMLKTWGIVAVCECPDCATPEEWRQFKAEADKVILNAAPEPELLNMQKKALLAMRRAVPGARIAPLQKKGGK